MYDLKDTSDCGIRFDISCIERCGKAENVAFNDDLVRCGYAAVYDDPDDDTAQFRNYERDFMPCGRCGIQRGAGCGQRSDLEKDKFGISRRIFYIVF